MLMTIEHPVLRVRCAFAVEKLLAASGMSPEDVARCFPRVPADLKEDCSRSTTAVNAFVRAWAAEPDPSKKPILPTWVVYIHEIEQPA